MSKIFKVIIVCIMGICFIVGATTGLIELDYNKAWICAVGLLVLNVYIELLGLKEKL